jgi:type II secretory pathway pseudopilin PulG
LSRIKHSAGLLKGQGMAIAGLVTGYFSIAIIPVIAILAAIAIPNFVHARQTAQKNACINNLRQIDGAKQMWALENKKESTAIPAPEDLDAYLKTSLGSLKCPAGGVYTIGAAGEKPTCSVSGHELPEN